MTLLTLGTVRYRVSAVERDGQWIARALRDDTGDPFGIECAGASETEAIARLTRWLEGQADHTAAVPDPQHAERAVHRAVAGGDLASPSAGAGARARPQALLRA